MLIDLDRRFLLEKIDGEPKAYQVTSVDTLTNRYEESDGGFLVWNMKQCEYNSLTDNADLMIADYTDAFLADDEESNDPDVLLLCEIEGKDDIRCGRKRTYKPIFLNEEGLMDDTVVPVWSLNGDTAMVTAVFDERDLIVSVNDDDRADGDVFVIELCDAGGKYRCATKRVEVTALL